MIARFLCWLGLHAVVVTHPGGPNAKNPHTRDVTHGYCTRCNRQFGWEY